jgi:acyl-coenzyme A synthetase/AMP-(fatty) acid ligase
MNFARYGIINGKNFPNKEYLVEVRPPKKRRTLTWKKFNEETNKVANYLQKEIGIKKGDFVLHLQMNSLEWVVTFHAILRLGAAAVPLSFRFAGTDIQYAARACNPKAFIFDESFLPRIEPIKEEMGSIDSFICIGGNVPEGITPYAEIIKDGDPTDILVDVQKDDPAELMFTSGTTGPPKPVCQSHDTLYQIGLCMALTFSLGHETIYLNPHPFYHSGSFFLNFAPYLAGGTTLILPDSNDPKFLIEAICDEKVNEGQISVPTMSDIVNAV